MEILETVVGSLEYWIWTYGLPVAGEMVPFIVLALLGTGVFMTLRLGFVQLRHLGHGFAVTSGKYDDPDEPGDVPHFQALTTALSATVGIGNIAGVAVAIHFGGPGALFWMWVTAFLGMAVKFSEVTLAQHYRDVALDRDPKRWEGSVSGGPMYYIERGLGPKFGKFSYLTKGLAVFFAGALMLTAFLTGNGVQANTVADIAQSTYGIPKAVTGLVTAAIVAAVILGGITRIGRVTGILAPVMAAIYMVGAFIVIGRFYDQILPTFGLIFREAFNPTAGVAGTGAGVFIATMMWGVRRGLFSNEAGQGSAPIAHAAAKTDEPVSEGVVALLEPFIDTIVICSMTGLVILVTGVWSERVPTQITLGGGDISYIEEGVREGALSMGASPSEIEVVNGVPRPTDNRRVLAWHEVKVEEYYLDPAMTEPFTGTIYPGRGLAEDPTGVVYNSLWGPAVENGAPLTQLAFSRGLPGQWGGIIVIVSVLLFAISTAIAWSYYGDRCANYLFGPKAILPYKMVFIGMHFFGAVSSLAFIWTLGDVALGAVTFPNLLALLLLSGTVAKLSKSYFQRKPWLENAEAHKRAVAREREERAARKGGGRRP